MIYVEISEELENDAQEMGISNELNFIADQFLIYKQASRNREHPAPSRNVQERDEPASEYFGRDRFDKFSKNAQKEEIQHVHLRQEDSIWEDEEGYGYAQWHCTSDSYLVYSYFKYKNDHYYYLIEFFGESAHSLYEKETKKFIQCAKDFRFKKLKELEDNNDKLR